MHTSERLSTLPQWTRSLPTSANRKTIVSPVQHDILLRISARRRKVSINWAIIGDAMFPAFTLVENMERGMLVFNIPCPVLVLRFPSTEADLQLAKKNEESFLNFHEW